MSKCVYCGEDVSQHSNSCPEAREEDTGKTQAVSFWNCGWLCGTGKFAFDELSPVMKANQSFVLGYNQGARSVREEVLSEQIGRGTFR
jgi:hypothetical protein